MEGVPEEKRAKTGEDGAAEMRLSQFALAELLCDNKESKTLAYRAEREGRAALVVLQKRDWVPALEEAHLAAHELPLELDVHNAEYFQFVASFPRDCDVKITWPATAAHLDKWRQAPPLLVRETPAMYAAATERFVAGLPAAHTAWVDNILEGRREADRVWLQHADFVVVPDFKVGQKERCEREMIYLSASKNSLITCFQVVCVRELSLFAKCCLFAVYSLTLRCRR